jgi:hypothetical protein
MDQKIKWVIGLSIALALISACSLLDNLNPFNDMASEIDDLAEQIPMEEIQDQIESFVTDLPGDLDALATDLPDSLDDIQEELETLATDLPGDLDALATDLPSEVDDILKDFEDFIDDWTDSDEIPVDIPVVEGETRDLVSSDMVLSYSTSMSYNAVLNFYQEQMPINGWSEKNESVLTADAAILYYEKDNREATVTLSRGTGGIETIVMIIIQESG